MAQIFISYAREDFQHAQELYQKLARHGYSPWLDKVNLLGGQKWRKAIEQAIQRADFFLLLLSRNSVKKRGFVQREIRAALDFWQEKLEDDIFLIPVLLEAMAWEEVPEEINEFQWVELHQADGWGQLLRALETGVEQRGLQLQPQAAAPQPKPAPPAQPPKPAQSSLHARSFDFVTVRTDEQGRVIERVNAQVAGYEEDLGHGVRLQMVEIPAGTFRVGSTDAEVEAALADRQRYNKDAKREWFKWETPRHRVAVPAFWLSRYQVTQEQWWAVARLPKVKLELPPEPSRFEGDKLPVEMVSWEEAVEFCQRLERQCKRAYRLPSEAEWEYACRAGSTTPFAFGPTITPELVNYDGNYPYGKAAKGEYWQQTVPVGSLGVANAFGLYDMHGNVWEWCEDDWHGDYNGAPTDGRAWVDAPRRGSYRVDRGGGWGNLAVLCRSAVRYGGAPGNRGGSVGFRLART
jgi:formylglycine-generating enzyme required for sulfatase activity